MRRKSALCAWDNLRFAASIGCDVTLGGRWGFPCTPLGQGPQSASADKSINS